MKRILFLILAIWILPKNNSFGQEYLLPIDSTSGQVKYVRIAESLNNQLVLFKNAQKWVSKTFNNYKAVVHTENPDVGLLVLKTRYPIPKPDFLKYTDYIFYTITIECKDQKFRITIDDFIKKAALTSQEDTMDFPVDNDLVVEKPNSNQDKERLARYRAVNELLNIEINETLNSLIEALKETDF